MAIFLDRVDSAPIVNSEFSALFIQWISVLVDGLNENLNDIQNAFNFLNSSTYTAAEIVQLNTDGLINNGSLIYDSTNNVYVGRENGSLIKFTTTPYP